jgi:phenylacetate-CoA ligase
VALKSEVFIWNKAIECIARPALEELQFARLRETVERLYSKVPLFKQRLDEAGVKPESLKSIRDLQRLPFSK